MKQTALKFLVGVAIIFALLAEARSETKILLNEKNTLSLADEFNGETVAKVMQEALQKDAELAENEELYLVLYTPGGSVMAGNQMIDFLKGLKHKVNTITIFSASMGFQTVQGLNKRYMIPSGVLMSHEGSSTISGTVPGQLMSRFNFTLQQIERLEKIAIARSKISEKEYKQLNKDEIWMGFEKAKQLGFIDDVAEVTCDSTLNGVKESSFSFFGIPVTVITSKCPLITGVLESRIGSGTEQEKTEIEKIQIELKNKFVHTKGVTRE